MSDYKQRFKTGDMVICIEDCDSFGLLKKGDLYTVEDVEYFDNGDEGWMNKEFVHVGHEMKWRAIRFIKFNGKVIK
jgi:hypothetical protein